MPNTQTLPPMPHVLFSRHHRAFVLAIDTRRRRVTYTNQPQRAMRLGYPQDIAQARHVCRVAGEPLELRQVEPATTGDADGQQQGAGS